MSRRTERIAEQLKGEVARILHEEVSDPRIRLVTLTHVDVSPDLRHASLLWSALDAEDDEALLAIGDGLHSAAGFVRRRLAPRLHLKRTPELHFRHDPSVALGTRTLSLLRSLETDEPS